MKLETLPFKTRIIILAVVTAVCLTVAVIILNPSYILTRFKLLFGLVGNEPPATEQVVAHEPEKGEPNMLRIPSLDINAPILYVNEKKETVFQQALQNGVVHYPDTALIGRPGNTYIFGHSSDMALAPGNYKTVFALLPNIQKDAEISLTDPFGTVFKYKVFDQFVAENTDVELLEQNTDGKKILTLQTSYPIGTALKRYIVKAELVE